MKKIIMIMVLVLSSGCATYTKNVSDKYCEKSISPNGQVEEEYFIKIKVQSVHFVDRHVSKEEFDKIKIGDNIGLY